MKPLRPAIFSDIPFLWYLRNCPYIRKVSRNSKAIPLEEHIEWITPVFLGLTSKQLFIIEDRGTPAGYMRLDLLEKGKAEVSIALIKDFQGKGLGTKALKSALSEAKRQNATNVLATVHKDNVASQKLFEKLGFKKQGRQKSPWLKYEVNINKH
jgi:RimJ/RimL family protein N-acetyltransferase